MWSRLRMLRKEETNTPQTDRSKGLLFHIFQLDWLGQMLASLLWIASVFVYEIQSTGDILQLCAALAWMIANIASLRNMLSNSSPREPR